MKIFKHKISLLSFIISLTSCTGEIDCINLQIQPSFIGYQQTDLDTLILRKFKANDNYQNLLDTLTVTHGSRVFYIISADTTTINFWDHDNAGIKAGNDWQIFIPAINRTIAISEISYEKKTGKCGSGIFATNKSNCTCYNHLYSAKRDNIIVSFTAADTVQHILIPY